MPTMTHDPLRIALISDVFHGEDGEERLRSRLEESLHAGARLAVLPELGALPWVPATSEPRDEDAEAPGGALQAMQSRLAAEIGIGLLGGAIVRDESSRRFNTCILFDEQGEQVHSYRKIHIPDEPGFHEIDHYEPGDDPPTPFEAFGWKLGIQICSDVNRPTGTHLLSAQGCQCVIAPRSTELATWWKWRPVFIANALTTCTYVLSVNRPSEEQGVQIGGPSIAVAPTGEVLLETTEPVGIVDLHRNLLEQASPTGQATDLV